MDLAGEVQELGVRLAFDREKADFSGITTGPFWIEGIQHCAVIEVNEEGTEAAAVTAIHAGGGWPREEVPELFHVEQPFLFYIADETTGAILFQGRIEDPRA